MLLGRVTGDSIVGVYRLFERDQGKKVRFIDALIADKIHRGKG